VTIHILTQGQLGRIGERFAKRGGRRGLNVLLVPERAMARKRTTKFQDVWAGAYCTFALSMTNDILVCGLNNYSQLGLTKDNVYFTLVKSDTYSRIAQEHGWQDIAPAQHHVICLDKNRKAYAVGRHEYGRLGLGDEHKTDAVEPTAITDLQDVVAVGAGGTASFAIQADGSVFSWGMGTTSQLGHETDDDAWTPGKMLGKQLQERNAMMVAGGGQHTVLLAKTADATN